MVNWVHLPDEKSQGGFKIKQSALLTPGVKQLMLAKVSGILQF